MSAIFEKLKIYIFKKYLIRNKGIIKKFLDERKLIKFISSSKRNAKGNYSDRKESISDGTWNFWTERRATKMVNNWLYINRLEFS